MCQFFIVSPRSFQAGRRLLGGDGIWVGPSGPGRMRQAERRLGYQSEKYSPYTHTHTMFCIQLQGRLSTLYSPMDPWESTDLRLRCPALALMKPQYCVLPEPKRMPLFTGRVGSSTPCLIIRRKTLLSPKLLNYRNTCLCPPLTFPILCFWMFNFVCLKAIIEVPLKIKMVACCYVSLLFIAAVTEGICWMFMVWQVFL